MTNNIKQSGFSLIEVLMAAAILAVGFMLILGTFPVGVHLTKKSTQRSIAAVAAEEAFAKIELYGIDFDKFGDTDYDDTMEHIRYDFHRYNSSGVLLTSDDDKDLDKVNISYIVDDVDDIYSKEKFYPSDENMSDDDVRYNWCALCRRIDPNGFDVQVTVFVSHKFTDEQVYRSAKTDTGEPHSSDTEIWPEPLKIKVKLADPTNRDNLLELDNASDEDFIADDSILLDERTGKIYRITSKYKNTSNEWRIELDRNWEYEWYNKDGEWLDGSNNPYTYTPEFIWCIPPAIDGDKSPCVGVFQRIMSFDPDWLEN